MKTWKIYCTLKMNQDKIHIAPSASESALTVGDVVVTLYAGLQVVGLVLDVGLFVGFLVWRVAEVVLPGLLKNLVSTVTRTVVSTYHLLCK